MLDARGAGKDVQMALPSLAKELQGIRAGYPQVLRRRDPAGGKFEAEACIHVHQALSFDAMMLGDYEFWTWLAVFHFRELVDWRHGSEKGEAAPENFGIGTPSENLLYRMWLRADMAYEEGRRKPYELARLGDQDFWRSHVFRQGYGRCRSLVKALIRFQFASGPRRTGTLKVSEIRELAKRLRRLHPNLVFEYLSEEDAYSLLVREAEVVRAALEESADKR